MKKVAKTLPVGRLEKRSAKKGSSTQSAKKPRSTTRYVEVKFRISAEEYDRGLPYFDELKYLPKFLLDAYRERINRAEANNKSARMRTLLGNIEILEPVLKEMYAKGQLGFLFARKGE